jgi:hypothetical protein
MPKIVLDLKFFSSYYISVLISYFLLQISWLNDVVVKISTWIVYFFTYAGFKDVSNGGNVWLVLFLSIIIFTFVVQTFVILPLDLYIHKDAKLDGWAKVILIIFVFGAQIYLINKLFDQRMPAEYLPPQVIKFLGGFENTFSATQETIIEKNLWSVRDMFWHIGPFAFMFFKTHMFRSTPKEG